jgi:WD40 repeat protein
MSNKLNLISLPCSLTPFLPLQDTKQLSVTNVRTLKMDDSVVSVCVSPDGKYVAVALLGDNKVKVNTIF